MGLHKNIETPDEFLTLFYEYKKVRESETITVPHATVKGVVEVNIVPPLTWVSFDAWLFEKKIIKDTEDYRTNTSGAYNDFSGVIRAISNIMYKSKFDGAAVGLYKENLIARDLGLIDKSEVNATMKLGKDAFKAVYD